MTRRTFFLSAVAGAIPGATSASVSFTEEMEQGDTAIRLLDAGASRFMVGVRTKVKCDQILVTVFYRLDVDFGGGTTKVLLSKESLAPYAGHNIYAATREDFSIPHNSVEFIRLTFFNEVGKQVELGRDKA